MRRYPRSFIVLAALGVACAIPGLISITGFGAVLFGSGAFPLVIEKLKEDEGA